ncbi:hypothetical protein GUJ93_ZPchr0008g12144 [Zizania palustris]|uniref:VQ domain-containing protein n=1 Tax=Zizania palustris TaxID=103762 RepID=A0A8J5RI62_ZIZPA|nr:hypothetical protein GUJ93_ZPchr0008g12144 [Zizania palustris]
MENSSSSQRGGRELQGPRPALLKVRKDSHKIRRQPAPQQPVQQVRPPLIIYTVSPKVVHANPAEFMSVVQRLTGPPRGTAPQTQTQAQAQPSFPFHLQAAWAPPLDGGASSSQHSPAARLAAIEQEAAAESADGGHHGASLPPLPGSLPASFFSPPAGAMGELMNPAAPPFAGATAAAPSSSPTPDAYYSWDLLNNINMH